MFIPYHKPRTHMFLSFSQYGSQAEDGESTVRCFLQALRHPEYGEARLYLSKNFADTIPLGELADAITGSSYKLVLGAEFDKPPKNSITKSVLLLDAAKNPGDILHLRMIKEPSPAGCWKIYRVERE